MVRDERVARSKAIQQRTGKTFHFATRLLPQRVRHATYVLYAFFRLADEVVDDAGDATPEQQRAELERLRAAALGEAETDDPVLSAFSEIREQCGIDDADVNTFVDAMVTDITKSRYETYAELEAYMDGSAAAVGRMMTAVMDPGEREEAMPHATKLGEAFQMSNFLRDVREDIDERDRIYLPQTTLREHDVTVEQIRRHELTEGFTTAMELELHRTETLYRDGVAGIKYLPEDCQFAVLLAAVLYADHHRLIRDRNYDALSKTPQLGTLRRLGLLARTRYHWLWTKDPEAVFWRVSSVSHRGSTTAEPGGRPDRLPTR